MIKSKFHFFQIQIKFGFRDPIELCKASRAKVRLIDSNGSRKRRFLQAPPGNFNPQFIKDHRNRSQSI